MHKLTIRGLDPETMKALKEAAHKEKKSVNQFVIETIKNRLGLHRGEKVYHDLDEFFGIWDEAEFQQMEESLKEQRRIDPEMWK